MSKLLREMSEAELREEWHRWDNKIASFNGWGIALTAAVEVRRDCARELLRRGVTPPEASVCPLERLSQGRRRDAR